MAILDYHQNKQTFSWNVIYCRFCGWLKTAYFGDFNKYGKGHSVEQLRTEEGEKVNILVDFGVFPCRADFHRQKTITLPPNCALGKLKARGFSSYNFVQNTYKTKGVRALLCSLSSLHCSLVMSKTSWSLLNLKWKFKSPGCIVKRAVVTVTHIHVDKQFCFVKSTF